MDILASSGWNIVRTLQIPPRKEELFKIDDLSISQAGKDFLSNFVPKGVYRHQKEAIQHFLEGDNICITTGAASGKSLPFYVAAIEHLVKTPSSKIIAIYPLKALGREQEDRWKKAIGNAGISAEVGRIDGQVPMVSRPVILRNSKVLILTPDIIHAWLFSNLGDKSILNFLKRVSLIIVDEIHSYTGVFGSNAAFLFRRIQHIMNLLGALPKYICASATISEPDKHLKKLFGFEFTLIGPEVDTSPKHELDVQLVAPPRSADLLTEVSTLLHHLANQKSTRFIAFVDSRKQTEHISSILARSQDKEEDRNVKFKLDHLERLNVLPYRAGYEERDRDIIQDRLNKGSLSGVVSTSALELGIDIPFLNIGVLIGVPQSSTSLHQRIGRIGRHQKGSVIVINTGDVYDEAIFRNPEDFLNRPMAEGALYLENTNVQYIHALCLARHGGEHDQVCSALNRGEESEFSSPIDWPDGFIDLCKRERLGEIPVELQSMKSESGDDPNHTFPLRDVESQFRVELKQGPELRSLGSLSYGQLMREAYPGAVYYYATQPFRVYRVNVYSKLVQVRNEKRYTTKPQTLATMVFPNLTPGNVYRSKKYGDLIVAECNLQIRESISGFKERHGPNEFICSYPLNSVETGIHFTLPRFTRNYFTTGVVITHPSLDKPKVHCEAIANLLYEVFLILKPFERRDISFAVDKHRIKRGQIAEGSRFLAIYDQTYGSLRLSGRLIESDVLQRTLLGAIKLLEEQGFPEDDPETVATIRLLYNSSLEKGSDFSFEPDLPMEVLTHKYERVILPGSKGINIRKNNEEFNVQHVFFNPGMGGLSYRGRHASMTDERVKETIPLSSLIEIPGESKIGLYNYNTGEIEAVTSSNTSTKP
jgi:DEAD/DEAH box helicase domain-containing protein